MNRISICAFHHINIRLKSYRFENKEESIVIYIKNKRDIKEEKRVVVIIFI